jgi:two-component system phosphate regulon response regulator PhoB
VPTRVLLVEDERDVAELVSAVLDFEGLEVRVVTGDAAMEQALSFAPDLVLLDLMMSGVNGFEVARRLRANEATRSIPIVVITAMHVAAARAAEVGADRYLAKPFDIADLIDVIHEVLGR